jgi:hypothetical protein
MKPGPWIKHGTIIIIGFLISYILHCINEPVLFAQTTKTAIVDLTHVGAILTGTVMITIGLSLKK